MAFSSEVLNETGATTVQLTGALDEHAQLPNLPEVAEVYVDLENLSYINSVGVRLWIRWVQEASKKTRIVLIKCPALFVKNLGSIRGMVVGTMSIQSFFVPYYDDKYNERKNVLFIRGKHFMDDGSLHMPEVKNANGEVIEPDVIEQSYFSFLKLINE